MCIIISQRWTSVTSYGSIADNNQNMNGEIYEFECAIFELCMLNAFCINVCVFDLLGFGDYLLHWCMRAILNALAANITISMGCLCKKNRSVLFFLFFFFCYLRLNGLCSVVSAPMKEKWFSLPTVSWLSCCSCEMPWGSRCVALVLHVTLYL